MRPLNKETIRKIKKAIDENLEGKSEILSIRSIAEKSGIPFQNVAYYLQKLIADGEVMQSEEFGYVLSESHEKTGKYRAVRLIGNVACGTLNIAEERVEKYIKLPEEMLGGGDYFLLTAKGNSMVDAGIDDGDMVLIKRQDYANEGQIAVVLSTEFSDDGATLKRYYPEPDKKRIRLHPENKSMGDFYIFDGKVQGIAEKVIKIKNLK